MITVKLFPEEQLGTEKHAHDCPQMITADRLALEPALASLSAGDEAHAAAGSAVSRHSSDAEATASRGAGNANVATGKGRDVDDASSALRDAEEEGLGHAVDHGESVKVKTN